MRAALSIFKLTDVGPDVLVFHFQVVEFSPNSEPRPGVFNMSRKRGVYGIHCEILSVRLWLYLERVQIISVFLYLYFDVYILKNKRNTDEIMSARHESEMPTGFFYPVRVFIFGRKRGTTTCCCSGHHRKGTHVQDRPPRLHQVRGANAAGTSRKPQGRPAGGSGRERVPAERVGHHHGQAGAGRLAGRQKELHDRQEARDGGQPPGVLRLRCG